MEDKIYFVDKTTHEIKYLGDIQIGFNMGKTIDGTKDSTKLDVVSFNGAEIEPLTIIWHENTNTWWCVDKDNVTRYMNEDNTFYYTHDLQLVGAIEILVARDLTDCGFNQNTYTIEQFLIRLFSLTNFEYPLTINYGNNIDKDKIIDYVKSYSNYTPLSALREFFDGYNLVAKLTFTQSGGYVVGATLKLLSRTGNYNTNVDTNIFNNVDETKSMDKSSFGTSVISNAENVISTKAKTFPTTGGIRLSANDYYITPENAFIRLPSNVFKVNWLRIGNLVSLAVGYGSSDNNAFDVYHETLVDPLSQNSLMMAILDVYNWLYSLGGYAIDIANDFLPNGTIEGNEDLFETYKNQIINYGTLLLYNEDNYNPIDNEFVTDNHLYTFKKTSGLIEYQRKLVLTNNEIAKNIEYPETAIYYERGSDRISNLALFGSGSLVSTNNTITTQDKTAERLFTYNHSGTYFKVIVCDRVDSTVAISPLTLKFNRLEFVVNYIPLSNIKIKYDNVGDRLDTQVYNQNGKLTDSVALSKLMLSYAKEIQSDTITKHGTFYDYSSIPNEGDIAYIDNVPYVISDVSMDFFPNEDGYFINAEFTLSKAISVKSIMVNPNTNIRDYGIPQDKNVYRRQLYRDFYELDFESNNNIDTPYLGLDKIMNISPLFKAYQEHVAVIKLTYNEEYGESGHESATWYYQLDTTTYVMKKAVYEIVDFKDNNIIGYGSQNVWCGFDIKRVLTNQTDTINTPISYVDNKGQFKGIEIAFCTNEMITSIYYNYEVEISEESEYVGWDKTSLYNYSVFIDERIFNGDTYVNANSETITYSGAKDNCDFMIEHNEIGNYYNKDAIEVPMFEYSCQIDDSDNVIIGNNILDVFEDDMAYMYMFALVDKNKANDNNFGAIVDIPTIDIISNTYGADDYVGMEYDNDELKLTLYERGVVTVGTDTSVFYGNQIVLDKENFKDKDLVVIRHTISKGDINNRVDRNDLFFIIKNIYDNYDSIVESNKLVLKINYYKLS